jgi:hypothetical protein
VFGGDFVIVAKYFARNLRLPFTPSLIAVFGPSAWPVLADDLVIVIEQEKKRNAVNKKDLFQPATQEI